jgi:HTH-type transcriptional regulator/antitoxin HigA
MKPSQKSSNAIADAAGVENSTALKTEEEYTATLALVETLMDAKAGSPEEEELKLWSPLVERYEQEQFPIVLPDLI